MLEFGLITAVVERLSFLQGLPIVLLLGGLALIIITFNERRLTLFLLPLLYGLMVLPYSEVLPSLEVGVKLLTGLFVSLLLVFAAPIHPPPPFNASEARKAYLKRRLVTAVIVVVILGIIGTVPALALPSLPDSARFINIIILLLAGLGAVGIWLSADIFSSTVGLLLFLAGFELYHAHLNQGDGVLLLFTAVNLFLPLLAAYLLSTSQTAPAPIDTSA